MENRSDKNLKLDVVVIGNNLSALLCLYQNILEGKKCGWVKGDNASALPVFPNLGLATDFHEVEKQIQNLGEMLGLDFGPARHGNFIKEFKNKAFRMAQPGTDLATSFLPEKELQFQVSLADLEQKLREVLFAHCDIEDLLECPTAVATGSMGQKFDFTKNESPQKHVGGIQCIFRHPKLLGQTPLQEGYLSNLGASKANGLERDQNQSFMGYFFDQGKASVWTVPLTEAEMENNAEIIKKLRKLKSSVEKMFVDSIPGFMKLVETEQVRLISEFYEVSGKDFLGFLTSGLISKDPGAVVFHPTTVVAEQTTHCS